jgi:Mechanosensitive ion channel, beta-domain
MIIAPRSVRFIGHRVPDVNWFNSVTKAGRLLCKKDATFRARDLEKWFSLSKWHETLCQVTTVEDIGLRSSSLRTFDRTVFTVPNGQIANACLENFSLRDSFWFHHIFSLRYETTAAQNFITSRWILAKQNST